jgi:hypothetical protein
MKKKNGNSNWNQTLFKPLIWIPWRWEVCEFRTERQFEGLWIGRFGRGFQNRIAWGRESSIVYLESVEFDWGMVRFDWGGFERLKGSSHRLMDIEEKQKHIRWKTLFSFFFFFYVYNENNYFIFFVIYFVSFLVRVGVICGKDCFFVIYFVSFLVRVGVIWGKDCFVCF